MKRTSLVISILIFSCSKPEESTFGNSDPLNFPRKETEILGDSIKVAYEYYGDTVVQERIDLKGVSGDGFDDSFTTVSVWSSKIPTDLSCVKILTISKDEFDFKFCLMDAIELFRKETHRLSVYRELMLMDRRRGTVYQIQPYTSYSI